MGNSGTKDDGPLIRDLGNGFYNIRGKFKIYKGLVDIGTHMSLIKLPNGKFLVIDTIPLSDNEKLKQEFDALTNNGALIEAVVATHPFHTLAFPAFNAAYPAVRLYGTPRHLRIQPQLPWFDDITKEGVRNKWAPTVEIRIPAGAEFCAPKPEAYNHFSSAWVYHRASRTVHVDDTIMFFHDPNLAMKLAGHKLGSMEFHQTLSGPGLYPTPEAPRQFQAWVQQVLTDWDFDSLCAAHTGSKIGGAKKALQDVLTSHAAVFDRLVQRNTKRALMQSGPASPPAADDEDEAASRECGEYNVEGCECG